MRHSSSWFRCALLFGGFPALTHAQSLAHVRLGHRAPLVVERVTGQRYQEALAPHDRDVPFRRFAISTPLATLTNFESEETNLHHYEFHVAYRVSPRDRVGLKAATWKLFEPMGIPLWDSQFRKKSEWYPGRLKESGIGATYQRLLWRGLFSQIEVLPLRKTYLNEDNREIGNGFKLYTSYHLGYQIPMFRNRIYFEPQVHCNYWPIDTHVPRAFKEKDSKWNNYFLFEPNVYIGIRF